MRVLKFGGTSVKSAERIRSVVEIVRRRGLDASTVIVVSALGGVTDELIRITRRAAHREGDTGSAVEALLGRHREALLGVAAEGELATLQRELNAAFNELHDLAHGVYLLREASPRTLDRIVAFGEFLSSILVAAAFRAQGIAAEACDTRSLIVTDDRFGRAQVDFEESDRRIRNHFASRNKLQVATGFISATTDGETTTLGRGGSDYTAAILGAALGADAIEIWTDVDGVLSADPRVVPGAFPLPELSYDELMELSHFGAKVIYPPTVHPARSKGIPLVILNTLNPSAAGTRIVPKTTGGDGGVRGISSIHRVALLRLEGDGMVGVPGIASRLFGALAREHVSIILISQASSEHSICWAIEPEQVERARKALHQEFALERRLGLVDDLVVESDASILAAVGEGMRATPGIAGKIFGVLGRAGVNVRAIAQGSSELNISLVVDGPHEARAVRAVHEAFFAPAARRVDLALLGPGGVGGAFLRQLAAEAPRLRQDHALDLRLVALASSRRQVIDLDGLDPAKQESLLEKSGRPTDLEALGRELLASRQAPVIVVDTTASAGVPGFYRPWLDGGMALVAANKRAFAGEEWNAIRDFAFGSPRRLYFETTVGAALPVLHTLADLVATGDKIESIEGALSGTMTYLAAALRAGRPLSDAVREAHEQGVTEPDPREDLGGEDVARKLVILGRAAGFALGRADVKVDALVPLDWMNLALDDFWQRLPSLNADVAERSAAASAKGGALAFLARLDAGGGRVSLRALPADHPAAALGERDNLVAIWTKRYGKTPLVIRGAGAGRELTASGVFADVLTAAHALA